MLIEMSSHIAIELFVDDLPSGLLNSFLDVLTHVLVIISQSILLFSLLISAIGLPNE